MGGARAELRHPPVAGEPGRVPDYPPETRMVRVLVLDEARREDDPGPILRMMAASLSAWAALASSWASPSSSTNSSVAPRIAAAFRASAERTAGVPCGRGLAAGADDEVGGPPGARLGGDHAPAAELDVVGMRAEGQEGAGIKARGSQ
jgi:hypothetical protein